LNTLFDRRLASSDALSTEISAKPFEIQSTIQPQAEEEPFFHRAVF
jgi:hypothetical protein